MKSEHRAGKQKRIFGVIGLLLLALVSAFLVLRGCGMVLNHPKVLPHWGTIMNPAFKWMELFVESNDLNARAALLKALAWGCILLTWASFFALYALALPRKRWRVGLLVLGILLACYATLSAAAYSDTNFLLRLSEELQNAGHNVHPRRF